MTRRVVPALVAALVVCSTHALHAEVFLLKSGGRLEGEHLNPQRQQGEAYQLRTDRGVSLSLAENQVARVVVKTDVQKQYDALLPKVPPTAEGHWTMAEWCKEAGLIEQRKRHLNEVIKYDSDHEQARAALGYGRYGSRWMTQEEFMEGQGYVRYKGAWRLKQEVELDAADRQRELAVKDYRRKIRTWFDQLGGKRDVEARRNLAGVRDPAAAPTLTEILADDDQPSDVRLLALELLGKLPPGLATKTLIKLAMDERDANIRDKCLDELQRVATKEALAAFTKDLQSKDNKRVNRAAFCIERLEDKEATLPLINALVTTHEFIISAGGSSGGGMPLNFSSGGGPGQGGLGGLSVPGKPKRIKRDLKNDAVLSALTRLNPGMNYQFNEEAWRKWYIENHTSVNVDLRRDD